MQIWEILAKISASLTVWDWQVSWRTDTDAHTDAGIDNTQRPNLDSGKNSIQERLKGRNTLGCLDQYAEQNSKYARPPIPSQPPTQKVFFQWHTQYDPTMKHSHCETVYAKELFQWLFFELVHSLRIL